MSVCDVVNFHFTFQVIEMCAIHVYIRQIELEGKSITLSVGSVCSVVCSFWLQTHLPEGELHFGCTVRSRPD